MHDVKLIRDDPAAFDAALARRGLPGVAALIVAHDSRMRAAMTAKQAAESLRNQASKAIGLAKARRDEAEAARLMDEVERAKSDLARFAQAEEEANHDLSGLVASIPNLPLPDVPDGADERDNRTIREAGIPRDFPFPVRDHVDLGEGLGLMDFAGAARMSGARFVALKGGLARLERALAAFMLDLQTGTHGYTEVSPPLLVRDEALFGTGQLPKFADDLFRTTGRHSLIPTSEVSLTNLVRETILAESDLPVRMTAHTPCFRAEAGSAGRDVRGMIRQHQFYKVELVSITTPEQSPDEHERMLACAEEVLRRLDLPFRTMLLCTGDMGFQARKTFDIEVWLPGQKAFREISSCSDCGDFQARRMDARYRPAGDRKTRFVHTLNGSGLAVGRTLVAVMENYQSPDGSIAIPDCLLPYMGGMTRIG